MIPFKKLSAQENEDLLKFPAYICMLASNNNDKLDEAEKKAAIKLSHTKTFSSVPLLIEFYKQADEVFELNIEQLDNDLPNDEESREYAINQELVKIEKIIKKLGKVYAITLHESMTAFKDHVSKAHGSIFVNFIIPVAIPGLTE
jgi:hypothetical protein